MEGSNPMPHTWLEIALGSLAGILTAATTLLGILLARTKLKADTDSTRAETDKTRAETRQIEATTAQSTGDTVLNLIREVSSATVRAERLHDELDLAERKVRRMETAEQEWYTERAALILELNKARAEKK